MSTGSQVSVNRTIVLVISTLTSFLMPFLVASVNVALPTMARELNMEAVEMTWVGTIYFLTIVMAMVPLGRLSDILGRRRLFIVGLSIAVVSSLLGGFAQSVPMLLFSRALQGWGAGMVFNNSFAILTSVYPSEKRGMALGISMAGTYAGLSMGPFIGGLLTEYMGWRSIFFVSAILAVLLISLVFAALKGEWREAKGEKFDLSGAIIFTISIAMFMYGFSAITNWTGAGLFAAGAAGLILFVLWEKRSKSPIFQIDLFRGNRVFLFSNLAVLVTYLSTYAVTYLLSLYLQYIKSYTPDNAGLVLIAASVLMTIFTPISGRISDRIEPRIVASFGMALTCASLIMFIFLGNETGLWYIILALALYGMGIGLFSSPNTNAIMGAVERRLLGVASGTMGTMRTAGMMLSMGITLVLFSLYIGQAAILPAHYPAFLTSVKAGFVVFSIIGASGFIFQTLARDKATTPENQESQHSV